jgi:hypothetical protein
MFRLLYKRFWIQWGWYIVWLSLAWDEYLFRCPVSSISAIFRTRTRNEGRDGSTRWTTFYYHQKSMESWVGTKNLVFCNGWHTPTLFQNLQEVINTRSISNSECASLSGVDFWFELQLGQTKDYDIGMCCFSLKHVAQMSKSKDKLAQNQDNVSEWRDMSTCKLFTHWVSTRKIQLSVLV